MGRLTLRRARLTPQLRALSREVDVTPGHFIQPLFVVAERAEREPVPGLDNVWRETPDTLLAQVEADLAAGIDKFLLFGVPAKKHATAFDVTFTSAQVAAIRRAFGRDAWIAVDTCLCSHTTHGHCGVLNDDGDYVDNATSVAALADMAVDYAKAGADCVAPSDMMDGRVAAIRGALDAAGADRTSIMSYAVKFHSSFYGPFRIAAESAPAGGALRDRATYQIDPARPSDALASAERDRAEGADVLMVKPALPYLDVLAELSSRVAAPWAAYQTSGEQAAIDVLAERGLVRREAALLETWTAFRRAGATAIVSYAARDAGTILGAASRDA